MPAEIHHQQPGWNEYAEPLDLSQILILVKLDVSALMGYTSAVFRNFFGTEKGLNLPFKVLAIRIFVPASLSITHV